MMQSIYKPQDSGSTLVDADDETMPDEDYNRIFNEKNKVQSRSMKENSNSDKHIGPNVNLKYFKKRWSTEEEKLFRLNKIKAKKKTELCKNWEVCHKCYFGNECSFAHGIEELRQKEEGTSPHKMKLCKSFGEKGYCNFGLRCNYRHFYKEKRLLSYDFIVKSCSQKVLEECKKNERMEKEEEVEVIYNRLQSRRKIGM